MEGDITAVVQPLHLIAHVLEQKLVLVQVHLQPPPQKPQQELHAESRDRSLIQLLSCEDLGGIREET